MHLLKHSEDGTFGLTKDLGGNDTIPPYAILSHRWGKNDEEVTFEDMTKGTGKDKTGYKKLLFCGEKARQDGLQHFWIDTCCIDKSNHAQLSREINAMFRRYRDANRCYVYLSDVPYPPPGTGYEQTEQPWESAFRRSQWFIRGWTLQELLAPSSVEFFSSKDEHSQEYRRLGNKCSLRKWIQEITGIPCLALEGARMSQFSVEERLMWIERRQTTIPEDKVYSLLGIFDVEIPLFYGEGATQAYARLREVIDRREKCMQDLCVSDLRDDKKRIEATKGGLLKDSYRWVLENSDFKQWRSAQQSELLWIKGDPGKGKTMLLCGIVDELEKSIAKSDLLSYFFCQATDSRIDSATAVLRGLIYLLVYQQPSLISHVRKKYDHAGRTLFEDANAWVALSEIFTSILRDPSLNNAYLVLDALDECTKGLPDLLDLIARTSSESQVRWLVSSRNWPQIEEQLEQAGGKMKLCLELNTESVSTAVNTFIQHKVHQLAQEKKYDGKLQDDVLQHLCLNAHGTFLWVALVCQNLKTIPRARVRARLRSFPPGLDSFYERMMMQISNADESELCKQILAAIATVYKPICLAELTSLVETLEDTSDDMESLHAIIGLCGSFLTIRNDTIYFVHQSAKDYLLAKASSEIFPTGQGEAHHEIFSRSLEVLSKILRRDIYSLHVPGYPIKQVEPPDPDPLAASRYSCIYWADHLSDWSARPCGSLKPNLSAVEKFVRAKYLYWLEALSLCKSISEGMIAMAKLEALLQVGPCMRF
jgi:NACHT domain/Heterokaryon incompatibility protein (HET)